MVRPIILYEIADGINLVKPFPQDLFQERDNLELKVLNYILYGNGKSIREISDTSIQLVRTCLVLNWDQNKKSSSIEKALASFVEVSTNGLIGDFIRIDLGKSYTWDIRKRNDPYGSGLIPENQSDRTNINTFDSIFSNEKIQQSLSQNHGTIRILLNRNNKNKLRSLIILSSANCFKMLPFNDVKYHNEIKKVIQQIKRSLLIPIKNSLGPLGITIQVQNLELDKLKETFQVLKYYLMDENERIYKPYGALHGRESSRKLRNTPAENILNQAK